jgi:Flp pilus assembly protein TadD
MSDTPRSPLRQPRRSMILALLATTAAASLLGACTQTGKLFSRGSEDVKMTAAEAAGATSKWAAAYVRDQRDPKVALGYAKALKAIGSRDRSLEVLETAYQANPNNGEVAAELGRLALEVGRLDIAKHTLKVAEAMGVRDWKTLSAQGTLHAKQGEHAEAQQYFLAALQEKPDAVSVINNLALSYALDGKADKSEELLRQAVASGNEDKRVRQLRSCLACRASSMKRVRSPPSTCPRKRRSQACRTCATCCRTPPKWLRPRRSVPTTARTGSLMPQTCRSRTSRM